MSMSNRCPFGHDRCLRLIIVTLLVILIYWVDNLCFISRSLYSSRSSISEKLPNAPYYSSSSSSYSHYYQTPSISLIIAMCKRPDLTWLKNFVSGHYIDNHNITILSKCGYSWEKSDKLPPGVQVQYLNNVGREGHTYFHWIVENYANLQSIVHQNQNNQRPEKEVLFFMKDNVEGDFMTTKSLPHMIELSLKHGFACLFNPIPGESIFHITKELVKFNLEKYDRGGSNAGFRSQVGTNLGEFTSALNITLPPILTPVCYRGHFSTTPSRIVQYPLQFWVNLRDALGRADNLEEGHYMERLWAAILSKPYFATEQQALEHMADESIGIVEHMYQGRVGCLLVKNSEESVGSVVAALANPDRG
mmetsp:Transcript_15379/g.32541  ORF Transcript_15379/g.32541 Transcript_15379/m.32541 type:complete len:362 (+) Transcript_15379:227-1312(+)